MKTVSVSELKARLSHYLREVRRGSEIRVVDRGRPVAQLSPIAASPADEQARERLVASGLVRPGSGDFTGLLKEGPVTITADARLVEAVIEDREDRV
jgi:prevent-host-death family protein